MPPHSGTDDATIKYNALASLQQAYPGALNAMTQPLACAINQSLEISATARHQSFIGSPERTYALVGGNNECPHR